MENSGAWSNCIKWCFRYDRKTRSTDDDVEEFNRTKQDYLSSLIEDDDDFNIDGFSGAGSGTTRGSTDDPTLPNQIGNGVL